MRTPALLLTAAALAGLVPLEVPLAAADDAKNQATDPKPGANADAGFEVETHIDLPYRTDKDADPVRHKLDLYLPKGAKDFPVLFFVHGGSWRWGSKGLYGPFGAMLARQGIGAAVINYRLSPAVKHPAHIEDVAKAFAWVHANVGKHGGRADRIIVCGHSAGGHLVTLLTTDEKYLKVEGRSTADIRGVIGMSGVYTISPLFVGFQSAFGNDPEQCKAASPLTHVRADLPPFLLLYADKDFPTLDKMAVDMCAALEKCKCDVKALEVKDRTHISIMALTLRETDPTSRAIIEFVEKRAEVKKPAKPSGGGQ
jgi:acetyl esterase/lipase